MKPRKLTAKDVTFTVEIEPEHIQVEGQFDSGDPEADKALVRQIIEAFNGGQVEAWCCIVVKATWERDDGVEMEGVDTLGCCSFLEPTEVNGETWSIERQIEEHVEAHGMREQALADLNAEIVRARKAARSTLRATAR